MKQRSGLAIAVIVLALVAITASPVLADGFLPIYFHAGPGPVVGSRYLDHNFPSLGTTQQTDSPTLTFGGGNLYQLLGRWAHVPNIGVDGDVHIWLGLKNSDDQGTNFDILVTILDGSASANVTATCITGITRNPALPTDVVIPVGFVGTTGGGFTSVGVWARIGTTDATQGNAPKCAGHSSATGLRLYYDSTTRPSGIYD